jgi:hypothetical protein
MTSGAEKGTLRSDAERRDAGHLAERPRGQLIYTGGK